MENRTLRRRCVRTRTVTLFTNGGSMKRSLRFALVRLMLAGVGVALVPGSAPAPAQEEKTAASVTPECTRVTLTMLDDLHKHALVSMTSKYIELQSDTPAAAVAKHVFAAMHKKGWHTARLVDATGKPKNKENLPKTDFEKKAAAAI